MNTKIYSQNLLKLLLSNLLCKRSRDESLPSFTLTQRVWVLLVPWNCRATMTTQESGNSTSGQQKRSPKGCQLREIQKQLVWPSLLPYWSLNSFFETSVNPLEEKRKGKITIYICIWMSVDFGTIGQIWFVFLIHHCVAEIWHRLTHLSGPHKMKIKARYRRAPVLALTRP